MENSKWGNIYLIIQKKCILNNDQCEGISCVEMNTNKYDSFILNEPTKKCFINNDKNKCEEIDKINCNEMNNSKCELFIIQNQVIKKCEFNIQLNKCKEIYKTCAEMFDNSFKELTFNSQKKKCIEINGHYEEKTCDEMNTINSRAFIQTESTKKSVLNSKF